MSDQLVFETEHIKVWYDAEQKIVHHRIDAFVYGDEFRTALERGADLFLEKGCTKYLSDDRNSSALLEEDVRWADEHWEQRLVRGGFRFWAIVLPAKTVGRLPFKGIIERHKKAGVEVRTFDNFDEAFAWLVDQG